MIRASLHLAAAAICLLLFLDGRIANAQAKASIDPSKNNPKILELFKSAVAKPAQSTVSVQIDGKQVALGIIVDADGFIITKSSELDAKDADPKANPVKVREISVKFKDGKQLPAKNIATNDDFDLAMLKVGASNLTPATWSPSNVAPVGNWVATPGVSDKPLAIGIVSVAARNMPPGPKFALPTSAVDRAYLGIKLAPVEAGVRITSVEPKAAADKAGLKAEDVILAVDGKDTPNPETLSAMIGRHKPGDSVVIRFRREGKEEELTAKLERRPDGFPQDRSDLQNSMGTARSGRRTGFPVTLQHDTDLKAAQCGGPLCDIEGRVIGINIARGGRTDTYAIPTESILPLLPEMMKGKSVFVNNKPAPLADKIKAAEAKVKAAEAEKSKWEKELAKAKGELEKLQADQKKEAEKKSEQAKSDPPKKEPEKK